MTQGWVTGKEESRNINLQFGYATLSYTKIFFLLVLPTDTDSAFHLCTIPVIHKTKQKQCLTALAYMNMIHLLGINVIYYARLEIKCHELYHSLGITNFVLIFINLTWFEHYTNYLSLLVCLCKLLHEKNF